MYAKLVDGVLVFAPKKLPIGNTTVWNPTPEQLLDAGYKLVVYADPPDPPEGYGYEYYFEEERYEIRQYYTLVELPDEVDEAEAYEIIFG